MVQEKEAGTIHQDVLMKLLRILYFLSNIRALVNAILIYAQQSTPERSLELYMTNRTTESY